jgi:hypothetical protein
MIKTTFGPDSSPSLPWSAEQVDALNRYQTSGRFHPFTCGNNRTDDIHRAYQKEHGGDFGQLVATETGWVCPVPGCGYKQDWAHGAMLADDVQDDLDNTSNTVG